MVFKLYRQTDGDNRPYFRFEYETQKKKKTKRWLQK